MTVTAFGNDSIPGGGFTGVQQSGGGMTVVLSQPAASGVVGPEIIIGPATTVGTGGCGYDSPVTDTGVASIVDPETGDELATDAIITCDFVTVQEATNLTRWQIFYDGSGGGPINNSILVYEDETVNDERELDLTDVPLRPSSNYRVRVRRTAQTPG